MLVEQFDLLCGSPLRIVVTPCHDITNEVHVGILCQHRILELLVAFIVAVALFPGVILIVLVSYLQVFDVKGCRMPVLCPECTVLRRNVTIGIFEGIHTFINPRLQLFDRRHATMPQADINDIERLRP